MIETALWLLVVGLCDLVRAARDATSWGRRALMAGLGTTLLLLNAVALDLSVGRTLGLLVGWVICFLLWLFGSAASLDGRGAVARTAAFVGLGGGLVFGIVGGGLVGAVDGDVPDPLAGIPLEDLVLVVAVALVQLSTANVVVRLVLDAVGVPAAANEKRLKGGRLLGPMERLFILGLGMAGQVTAAAVVVAAKGLLRFPELQRGADIEGPSDVTEYFLIGSFASWLVALGGLGLVALGLG